MVRWRDGSWCLASLCIVASAALSAGGASAQTPAQQAPSPESFLGRPVGTDFQLADWEQIQSYFRLLDAASPTLQTSIAGTTTEGRNFLLVTISSAENLARLPELKEHARAISDPRKLTTESRAQLLERARPIFFISCNMHSTEIASPEMSMELAYLLATSPEEPWVSARRELVVVIAPSLNPDGLDHVVNWYRRILGTPYESASLPILYQLYAGHDNNRDWFMLALEETRIVTRLLYTEWLPQVYWDVHQQGSNRERMFVPPFRDPLNPNLDPAVIAGIGALGSRIVLDLTRAGFTGVSTGVTYDMWWNGGNRNVPVRHNMIGLLSEAASANLASPIFLSPTEVRGPADLEGGNLPSNRMVEPWPGGWWRIGDIVRYELAMARALVGSLAREPRAWLTIPLEAAERALARAETEVPVAWLIPPDSGDRDTLERLLENLLALGIEVHAATAAFEADGRSYASGTWILKRAQPNGNFVKDLFEVQKYPSGPPPYDVTGWTLPLLMGFPRVEVMRPFAVDSARVRTVAAGLATLTTPPDIGCTWPHLDPRDAGWVRGVLALLEAGLPTAMVTNGSAAGSWLLPSDENERERARGLLTDRQLAVTAESPAAPQGTAYPEAENLYPVAKLPRVGLYAPWAASMDEGWTRWVLDHYRFPYVTVRNEMVRAGELARFLDVLVIPGIDPQTLARGRIEGSVFPELAGGLDPEGAVAIEEFVRGGGTVVAFERACEYLIDLCSLPLENAARAARSEGAAEARPEANTGFSCPGAVLRTLPDEECPWNAGLPATQPVFFSDSLAFRHVEEPKDKKVTLPARPAPTITLILRYPKNRILLSGGGRQIEQIGDTSAWVRVAYGKGQIHLFGFRPQYRGWSHATFPLLFRALLLPPSQAAR